MKFNSSRYLRWQRRLGWTFQLLIVLISANAFANPIDDNCPKLTYKQAPVIQADQYICHTEYAVALSYETRNPIYTTEYYEASHTGHLKRPPSFRPDPKVPRQYAVITSEYRHTTCHGNPCDRGHMTPADDFNACKKCLLESFYTSNIVPQNKRNNEIIWEHLEAAIRAYAAKNGPVYIITGPVYGPHPDHIGHGIAVPDQLFKVIIDPATGRSAAFMMPNQDLDPKTLSNYQVSLSDVEAATGIEFNNSLDKHSVGVLPILPQE